MSVRKIPKSRITKDGRSYAFIVAEYGLDGKRHQHQSKAYMTEDEAIQAEKAYLNKYKDDHMLIHILRQNSHEVFLLYSLIVF